MNNNEEIKIPNYLGYAIVIITADHLGAQVNMLEVAKTTWRTKRMPDAIQLGTYANAAHDAVEKIKELGLETKADRFGAIFNETGEFPKEYEIKRYRDYLSMYVLKSTLGDCTNNGLTSCEHNFDVFAPYLTFAQIINYCEENGMDESKVLKLVYRRDCNYIHAEPIIRGKSYMAGGNYIYTCDSRFTDLTSIYYPVPVHDRAE